MSGYVRVAVTKLRFRGLRYEKPPLVLHRALKRCLVLAALAASTACQSPTSTSSTLNVDDFVDATISPSPAPAAASTGKTYRVVRGNNQPDEVLPYQFTSTFSVTTTINSNANDDSVKLSFPVTILSASGKVEQASGGIVTPPSGGEVEHYESIILSSSGSTISGVGAGVTMVFQVWYALPSGNREARVTESVSMKDNGGKTFAKDIRINIAP
jgi:hypothetical protein